MTWFCGGHGSCLDPLNPAQDDRGLVDNLRWFDQYLAGNPLDPADDIPAFQWYDQTGAYGSSDKLPFEAGFNEADPYTTTGDGGRLGVWPLIGGSGPGSVANISKLITFPNATTARNALNVSVAPPVGAEVVGAPTLSFNYSGIGTTRTIYAQLVDNATGRVLGNVATPIPVTFDGKQHSLTIPMANIVYAAGNSGSLTLQITSSATNFENFTSFGSVKISDIKLDLPIRAQ
jgi:ABC-2 type transport system ATP-binding protein